MRSFRIVTLRKSKDSPTLMELAYVKPITGPLAGQGRRCGNCAMYIEGDRCMLWAKDFEIDKQGVCNYHVPGKPHITKAEGAKMFAMPGRHALDPKTGGYEEPVPAGGTKCDNCTHYDSDRSRCLRARGRPSVEALGCCNGWVSSVKKSFRIVEGASA